MGEGLEGAFQGSLKIAPLTDSLFKMKIQPKCTI